MGKLKKGKSVTRSEPSYGFSLFAYGVPIYSVTDVAVPGRTGCAATLRLGDNLPHLRLDAVVVLLYRFLHAVVAVGIGEVRDDGDGLVSLFLALHLLCVHHNLAMKDFLLDALVEVVRHRAHEHALRERGNLARGYQALHLRVDGSGLVLAVDGDALPLLQDFSETLGKGLGGLAHYLPGEDVAHRVHHYGGFFVPIIALQLREVLKTEADRHLIASGGGDKVIQPLEVNRGQLVDNHRRLQLAFLVDKLHDAGIVQAQRRAVDVLTVGIVADTEDFRLFGIVNIQCKLAVGHDPIELGRNHARERYLRRGYLSGKLFHRAALPSVHERGKIILQLRVAGQNRKHVLVTAVQQFDGMGKSAILTVLVDAQKPYHGSDCSN